MRVAFVFGTRPEIIKSASPILEAKRRGHEALLLHTGQHYSPLLSETFLRAFDLPPPAAHLGVESLPAWRQGETTARMMTALEQAVLERRPDFVVVQGDTNTVLAGALVCSKINTTRSFTGRFSALVHLEAGLRSFDRSMPEEINRVVADHLADVLLAPLERHRRQLEGEGIVPAKIHVIGNTIADAVRRMQAHLRDDPAAPAKFCLVTAHRQETVDVPARLAALLACLGGVKTELGLDVLWPIHPRSVDRIRKQGLAVPDGVRTVDPLGYVEFLSLLRRADLVVTDSGGVQEEGAILGVPTVTIRDNTERPETVDAKTNVVTGVDRARFLEGCRQVMKRPRGNGLSDLYGPGDAGARAIDVLERLHGRL